MNTMKKLMALICFATFAFNVQAQRYACIDSDYILNNMTEYIDAQAELDRMAVEWQKEIDKMFKGVDSLYRRFEVEAPMLPDNMKEMRKQQIIEAEKEAKDLQRKRFGKDGDLFKKRMDLIKPIQDRVFTSIEDYAKEKAYAFVFDKAGAMTILYVDPKFDISEAVMQRLGVVAKSGRD